MPEGYPANDIEGEGLLTICLLGLTGVGKSATGNTLLGDRTSKTFKSSDKPESETSRTTLEEGLFGGDGQRLRVVDTPGWLDTKGSDADNDNRRNMTGELHRLEAVDAFLLLLSAQDHRFNSAVTSMLKMLVSLFGHAFLRNLVIGFTRWGYDQASRAERAERLNAARPENDDDDEEEEDDEDDLDEDLQEKDLEAQQQKASDVNSVLRNILSHHFDFPCIFIDNRVNYLKSLKKTFRDEEEKAKAELKKQLQVLKDFTSKATPFNCNGVRVIRAERMQEVHQQVPYVVKLSAADDAESLGRKLVATDKDVLYSGWLWWNRTWIYGKLRREFLRFYQDDGSYSQELPQPAAIDLQGCVCVPKSRPPFATMPYHFSIYRPQLSNDGMSMSGALECRLAVKTARDQRQWISLVMEATQISDGCSKVRRLKDRLLKASQQQEYMNAILNFESGEATIVVPVDWMQHSTNFEALGQGQDSESADKSLIQLKKDLEREDVDFDGEEVVHKQNAIENLMERTAIGILDAVETCNPEAEAKLRRGALALARDTTFSASRTINGSEAMCAVKTLFEKDDLFVCPVQDHILCEHCNKIVKYCVEDKTCPGCESKLKKITVALQILQNKRKFDAFDQVDDNDGCCGIKGREVKSLGMRQSRSTAELLQRVLSGDCPRAANGTVLDRTSAKWIPDEAFENCLICGLSFRLLRRRHHCRACGKLVCWACSDQRLKFEESIAEERACMVCYSGSVIARIREILNTFKVAYSADWERVFREKVAEVLSVGLEGKTLAIVDRHGTNLGFYWNDRGEGELRVTPDPDVFPLAIQIQAATSNGNGLTGAEPDPTADSETNVLDDLPCVSVSMFQIFKICDLENPELVLFYLHCRHIRYVRWNGHKDSGRVEVTIIKP